MSAHKVKKMSPTILISMSTSKFLGVRNSKNNNIRDFISTEFAAIQDNNHHLRQIHQLSQNLYRSTQRVSVLFHNFCIESKSF